MSEQRYPAIAFTDDGDAWRVCEDGERPARGEVALVPYGVAKAAPELLAALEEVTEWLAAVAHNLGPTNERESLAQIAAARAAIAKAVGRE